MTIWTYWEGDRPPIIDLCLESIQRWNPDTRILDPAEVRKLGGGEILEKTKGLLPAYRSDLLRCWLLLTYGGWWIDADTIAVHRFDLADCHADYDLVGVWNRHQNQGWGKNGMLATPIGGHTGSPIWEEAYQAIMEAVNGARKGKRIAYGYTSVGIASELYRKHEASPRVRRFEHWKYNPVPWYRAREVYFRTAKPWQHEWSFWNPNACLYHLTNVVTKTWKTRTRHQLLSGNSFTSYLFQKAFSRRPAIFGRTIEICKRLPAGPVRGAEVGVLRGVNARHLLQQRRDLQLLLVDRWAPHPPDGSYRKSGDEMARWSADRWERVYRTTTGKTLRFASDRWEARRMPSVEAAATVPDGSLDIVFIDADHSYPGVRDDIKAWWPKVKPGGFIGGHDYGHPKNKRGIYGVNKAVREFMDANRLQLETGLDWTWFVRKPKD